MQQVGFFQPAICLLKVSLEHKMVPFGDQVAQRAAGANAAPAHARVAKRHAAVHTSGCLLFDLLRALCGMKCIPVLDALLRAAFFRCLAVIF
ncbi:hypothetical protein SDC9_127636 [bioreactor metagenome]|uniref:Uncharacterized protein n=1 Tax=bioreactor metagenome TaxID=1076179 RepID=A0A645CUI4_9ZZZZ